MDSDNQVQEPREWAPSRLPHPGWWDPSRRRGGWGADTWRNEAERFPSALLIWRQVASVVEDNLALETGLGQVTRSQQESPRVPNSPGEPPALATPRNTSPKPASFPRDPAPVPASMETWAACYQFCDLWPLYS